MHAPVEDEELHHAYAYTDTEETRMRLHARTHTPALIQIVEE